MIRGQRLDPVDGEDRLAVDRMLDPETAVLVEGGDAILDRDEPVVAFIGRRGEEIEDRRPGGAVVPGGKRIVLGGGRRVLSERGGATEPDPRERGTQGEAAGAGEQTSAGCRDVGPTMQDGVKRGFHASISFPMSVNALRQRYRTCGDRVWPAAQACT